ncbi:MAG: HIT family protein [Thermoplasmata archaeon]
MKDCIFCAIGSGAVPSHRVYEDAGHVAFLDAHPIRPGHTLVVPRRHIPYVQDMDAASWADLMEATRRVARVVHETLAPVRVGLLVAGWDVAHVHVHVVPMQEYHDLTSRSILEGTRASPSLQEFQSMVARLRGQ